MKKFFYLILTIFALAISSSKLVFALDYNFQKLDDKTDQIWSVDWNSDYGLELLAESSYKKDFYHLVNFFQPQINPLLCSAATSVIILNALNYNNIPNQTTSQITKPIEMGGGVIEFPLFTQEYFFNNLTDQIKDRHIINLEAPKEIRYRRKYYDPGLSLKELHDVLTKIHKLKVKMVMLNQDNEQTFEDFRQDLQNSLNNKNQYFIANFDGQILGKKTHGHISPIIAFNEKKDKVLVMDVALHKNQWYWTDLRQMYKAMNTKDGNKYRGYLLVGKN